MSYKYGIKQRNTLLKEIKWIVREQGRCGIRCTNCPYLKDLCFGCTAGGCLVWQCIKGISYTGLTYPKSFCTMRSYCPIGGKTRSPPLQVPSIKNERKVKVDFPKFVPEIDTQDEKSWFWNEGIKLPAIFVPLWQLLVNENVLSNATSKGLHDYLGFDGKILLSTVMQDEFIDKLKRQDYFQLITDLRPDATMVPDNYTYTDVPLYQSWTQTIRLVTFANDFLDLQLPVIGLVKGADTHQIRWALQKQIEMGYVSFVMPARELLEQRLLEGFVSRTLDVLGENRNVNGLDWQLLLYGVAYRIRHEGVSYSNLSWFIEAKHEHYFKNGRFYEMGDPEIRYEECHCEICKGRMPQELFDTGFECGTSYIRTLTTHNLLALTNSFAGK